MNQNHHSLDHPLQATGRFGRLSYFAWSFVSVIITMLLLMLKVVIFEHGLNLSTLETHLTIPFSIVLIIIYLTLLYFNIIFMIRRLHDRNHSGWVCLLIFVPFINFIFALYVICATGTQGSNQYGVLRQSAAWEKVLGWAYIIIILMMGMLVAIALPEYQNYIERVQ